MQLLASMRDSLTIFKPKNFKLFVVATLKSLLQTYKVWLKYWWWLVIITITLFMGYGFKVFDYSLFKTPDYFPFDWWDLLPNVLIILSRLAAVFYVISLVISTRLSLGLKDGKYIKHFKVHLLYAVPLLLVAIVYLPLLFDFLDSMPFASSKPLGVKIFVILISSVVILFVPIFMLFFLLFLFDSDGSVMQVVKSVGRAGAMLLYNLPLYISMTLLFGVISLVCMLLFFGLGIFLWIIATFGFSLVAASPLIPSPGWEILGPVGPFMVFMAVTLLLPFAITIVTNLYVKRVHEQYNLYYQ